MLAIIWALKKLKIYLYGEARVKIFTDHQPLTHSLSSWNGNARIKRWMTMRFFLNQAEKILYPTLCPKDR